MRGLHNRLSTRFARIQTKLAPPPVKDTRLPYLVFMEDKTGYPGYEAHNREHERIIRRQRLVRHACYPKVYFGFDPNDDGVDE